ncbi:MAG TPA: HEPN domain-containing protein [Anaerolineae bacterium]|nr:HEPN domain-containing protein [Anaerolineae bacterium]
MSNTNPEAGYRLRLAQGFLEEARQDVALGRWRAAVDNSQLCVENAAKAVLALLGPVGRTHNPASQLRQALNEGRFPAQEADLVRTLAERAELLGLDIHIQTDYGDETDGRTPWELFDEGDAHQALQMAEEAFSLAERLIRGGGR